MIELRMVAHLAYTALSLLDLGSIGDGLRGPMTWVGRYGYDSYPPNSFY
jgi:hypothetical protein